MKPLIDESKNINNAISINNNNAEANAIADAAKTLSMDKLELNMHDADHNKYNVIADIAYESQPNEIFLQSPKAFIFFNDNTPLDIIAKYGKWFQLSNILKINQDVSMLYDQQYQANTQTMTIDTVKSLIIGDDKIKVNSKVGTLDASSFKADNIEKKIYFAGPIKVVLKRVKDQKECVIVSDNLMIDQITQIAEFSGHVISVQEDTTVKSDKMFAYYTKIANQEQGNISKIINVGNVYIINENQVATGKKSIYLIKEETITLNGGVSLKNGDNIVKGETLIYDLKNHYGKILPLQINNSQKTQVKAILRPEE